MINRSRNRITKRSPQSSRSSRSSRVSRFATDGPARPRKGKVRYAVVGLGHIAQIAVLPAFAHAANSELAALVSDTATKLRELGRKYRVPTLASYKEYDALLRSGKIDAVYIAEPNSLHLDFTLRAARAGVHVLCEKPLALTAQDCQRMIQACRQRRVKLMTAYRLHFEKSNLEAIRIVQSGKLGEVRFFNSTFSMQVRPGNIRLQKKLGGGPLYDLGVYCINAARYLFRAEPIEVKAITASGKDRRFREVEEMAGVILRFPEERLATFLCSFGSTDTGAYQVVGTKGSLELKNAYEYALPVEMTLTVAGKTSSRSFKRRDQFAPELIYFSDCIMKNKEPEPSGVEGLNDVRVLEAIFKSTRQRSTIKLQKASSRKPRPTLRQEIQRRPVKKPELVRVQSASQE